MQRRVRSVPLATWEGALASVVPQLGGPHREQDTGHAFDNAERLELKQKMTRD